MMQILNFFNTVKKLANKSVSSKKKNDGYK